MSGYIVLQLKQQMGQKLKADKHSQLFLKIFSYREGQVKEFYKNVRIYTKQSRSHSKAGALKVSESQSLIIKKLFNHTVSES